MTLTTSNEQNIREATPRVFPLPGTTLYDLIHRPEFRQAFHSRLKLTNRFVVLLYRLGVLPLLGLAKQIMLLTTRGRKSGQPRHFPVGYVRIGDAIYLFSSWGKQANWYKNLVANPDDVTLQVGFRRLAVNAKVLDEPMEIKRTLGQFVSESPSQAKNLIGWDPDRDRIEAADFSPFINQVLVVRFVERTDAPGTSR